MENEPAIGKGTLIRTIQQEYGIDIESLRFHQRGWGGDCYVAETHTGKHFFLKLHDQEKNAVFAASSRAFYLPLMDQLYTKGILPHIPHPIPTRNGNLSLGVDSQELVITHFIEGEDVRFGALPEPILVQLADRVGILHSSRKQLAFKHPFIEQFEIAFEPILLELMDELGTITSVNRQGQQLLRDALVPRKGDLFKYLDRLKERQTRARSVDAPMVICHTDLHGGNLRTDGLGNLYILDWENAMIAPREHDMIFFAGERCIWEIFWPTYRSHFSQVDLDREVLGFYYYRRGLEDIADYIFRIMQGDGSETRDQSDVRELIDCLDGLANVEQTLSQIRDGLG